MLSHIRRKNEIAKGKSSKLITILTDKQRCVSIHGMNLNQAVNAGLILTKIHRVI